MVWVPENSYGNLLHRSPLTISSYSIHAYMYTHITIQTHMTYVYIYIYIHICIERERERVSDLLIHMRVYIYGEPVAPLASDDLHHEQDGAGFLDDLASTAVANS